MLAQGALRYVPTSVLSTALESSRFIPILVQTVAGGKLASNVQTARKQSKGKGALEIEMTQTMAETDGL